MKNPGFWERDSVQFPRLLAEIWAIGVEHNSLLMEELCKAMDLSPQEVDSIFQRADARWEEIKAKLDKGSSVRY